VDADREESYRSFRTFCRLLVVSLNGALFFVFHHHESLFRLPASGAVQMYLVFLFYLITGGLLFVFRHPAWAVTVGICQLLGMLITGAAFGEFIWIEALTVMAVLACVIGHCSPATAGGLGLLALAGLFDQRGVVVWGVAHQPVALFDLTLAFAVSAGFALTLVLMRRYAYLLSEERARCISQRNSIASLTAANLKFQQYASIAEEVSLKNERTRISREIHDTVGYTMTSLNMMLEACTDLIERSPLKLETTLYKALALVKDGHTEIRHALRELRTREVDVLQGIPSYQKLVSIFRESTGVRVHVEWGNIPWYPDKNLDRIIYRFLQEGMSNSLSHGEATEITIFFRREEGRIIITLTDNGGGVSGMKEGLGMKGMRERIHSVRGEFHARNVTGGFMLKAELPYGG